MKSSEPYCGRCDEHVTSTAHDHDGVNSGTLYRCEVCGSPIGFSPHEQEPRSDRHTPHV